MLDSLDDVVQNEIAIHASLFEEQAVLAPLTPDPQKLEHLLRQNCRDLIAASYDSFQTAVLEHPLGTVYALQKQQAIVALKEDLRAKAAAATSAEERQIYLNYARVAHLQFAQKAKHLDAVVVQYNQDVPELQHYACSTTGYTPSSSGVCGGLAALSMGLLGMANKRIDKKRKKAAAGSSGLSSSQTLVPPQLSSLSSTSGQALPPVDQDVAVPDPDNPYDGLDVADSGSSYVDNSAQSRAAKAQEDGVFVFWDDANDSSSEDCQDSPTSPGNLPGNKVIPLVPSAVPFDEKAEPIEESPPKPEEALNLVILPPGSPAASYKELETLAAKQQGAPRSSFLEKAVYGTLAVAALATAVVRGYDAFSSPHSDVSPKQVVVASALSPTSPVSVASPAPSSYKSVLPTPLLVSSSTITYERTTPPVYDAENPVPWYQIEKANLRNNGKTLDLRLGPHLSMDGRTVRLTYDVNGDGKADRTRYVDSQEQLTITVPGNIIDVGVGFKDLEQPGFNYHSSLRFESNGSV